MAILTSIIKKALGELEYSEPSERVSQGPVTTDEGDVFEIILYVRTTWYKNFPRLTRRTERLYHIRKYYSQTSYRVLVLRDYQIHNGYGRVIKNPMFGELSSQWLYSTHPKIKGDWN